MNDIDEAGCDDAWRKYQVKGKGGRRDCDQKCQQYQEYDNPMKQHKQGNGGNDQSWLKYKVGGDDDQGGSTGRQRSGSAARGDGLRQNKRFGREPRNKLGMNERQNIRSVKQMPFTDQFGDCGDYTGLVNEEGRPDGKGSMKYENGVFYEGTWMDGCQDKNAVANYDRIRGGFTSWSGKGKSGVKSGTVLPWNARKHDVHEPGDKINVRGMEWTDLNGDSGRYTGEVNHDRLPHGRGIMKYSYGLIAEGQWVNGVLKEGPQDRMIGAAASVMGGTMSVGPGMSIGGGGMSVVGGGMSLGPMSVGPMSIGPMSMGVPMQPPPMHPGAFPMATPMPMMQPGPPPPMQYPMMGGAPTNAAQHAMVSQQNAMMRQMHAGAGESVYGGPPMGHSMHGMPPMQMQQQKLDKPPISEIKIGN